VTAEVRKKAVELDEKYAAQIRDYAKKGGKLQIFELNADQIKALQKAVSPVHSQFTDIVPAAWIEKIKGM